MAYEYEDFIDAMRFGLTMSDRDTTDDIWNMVDEVVNKAKAWDNYLADVENSVREVTGNEDEVKWHVDYVINEYMEDK